MARYVKLAFILFVASILLLGCGSDDESSTGEQNGDDTTDVENTDNAAEDEQVNENESILTELHSFQDEDDIHVEDISINYDGSVVFFNEVEEVGDDEEFTPYFIHNGEVKDVSSIDTYSNCRFYSINEENTYYFTGTCYDENDDRVSVVYDIENDTISHTTDRDKMLTVLADGRVLFFEQYENGGEIYELTENGEELFLDLEDMTDVLGISADQQGETFFIYGANNDYWNSYIYDAGNDSEPVLFEEVPDDDEAKTVEGNISPDGKYIMYRYRGVSGGEHYNYTDGYIFDRDTEEEIHLGHGFDMNFVRPNGYIIDEVREYGQVIFNVDSSKWLAPEEKDFSFTESLYATEYVDEEEGNISTSAFIAISGDGETTLMLDTFNGADSETYFKIQTIKTEDYIRSLEDQDVEIDFEPSPFNEIGA